jgi:hypothetical protein
MIMRKIPKYIEDLLQRRRNLAMRLMDVCVQVDEYCKRIGVDMNDNTAAILTDVMIYCEPDVALRSTREAIQKVLDQHEKECNKEQ